MDNLSVPGTAPADTRIADAVDSTETFTTGGNADWDTTGTGDPAYYGENAAVSGFINNSQTSYIETSYTASAGDIVSFYWKVSSERNYTYSTIP